jgi:hypothetical protein
MYIILYYYCILYRYYITIIYIVLRYRRMFLYFIVLLPRLVSLVVTSRNTFKSEKNGAQTELEKVTREIAQVKKLSEKLQADAKTQIGRKRGKNFFFFFFFSNDFFLCCFCLCAWF